jgi:hypothetical protein
MNEAIDYKKKYLDLRARMVSSMDLAFRMGYQQGAQEANQQAMQQQMQMQQAQQQQMMAMQGQTGQEQEGQPGEPQPGQEEVVDQGQEMGPGGPQEAQPVGPQPEELDQYIGELESLVSKGELSADDLKKSIEKLKSFQVNVRLTKSLAAIKTPKSLSNNRPMKLNPRAAANLTHSDKSNLSMQERVISNIMKKWEDETPKVVSQAMQTLGTEALTKGE